MSKNKEYAEKYAVFAMEQMRKYGIPASVTLAQGILESSNGQSRLSLNENNHFGIKATPGWIAQGGKYGIYTDDKPNEKFCSYDSVGDSYEHHSRFLVENKRYAECFDLSPDDYKGWTEGLAKEYYDGDGINEQYTFASPRQNKGDDLLIEDKDFAVIYNNSVGGTYEVMLKYSEQEIRDHITRYGVRLASSDIKEVAKDMAAEQFSAMTKQRTPVLEMPNGDILHIGYNRDADTLDVGTATNAGIAVSHSFPYDHDNSLDSNLQSVNEKLNEMEQYQKEEVEYSGGMHR